MGRFEKLSLAELIRPEGYDCPCGMHHACSMDYLRIGRNCIGEVPQMLEAVGSKRPFIVFDANTREVAGNRVCAILEKAGIPYAAYEIPVHGERLSPAEWETGSVVMHFDPSCDFILGVGSGVINDICKVVGHAIGKKNGIIGTAPSMDGYASDSSAMEVNHVKCSINNQAPSAILLDVDILAAAPMRMLWAGFGDMIAKAVALCEWRISHIVTEEAYCGEVADLTRCALTRVLEAAPGIPDRDPEAVQRIAEGLVISGISMAYKQNSRAASGLEHYYSHMWEMMALDRNQPYDLHGIQVGIGMLLTLEQYRKIQTMEPDQNVFEQAEKKFDPDVWEQEIHRIFGKAAPEIFAITGKGELNNAEKRRTHFERLEKNWAEVQNIIREELPDYDRLKEIYDLLGMPQKPEDIGISEADTADAFQGSRNLRNKYLTSTMLWDLGVID